MRQIRIDPQCETNPPVARNQPFHLLSMAQEVSGLMSVRLYRDNTNVDLVGG